MIQNLLIHAGFCRPDPVAFHAALRQQPGCQHVSLRTVYNYLNRKSAPRGAFALGFATLLGVSLEELQGMYKEKGE